MHALKRLLESILPRQLYRVALAPYHLAWTCAMAIRHGFPAHKLVVIGVTGTKGKSSVAEMLAACLTEGDHRVAVSNTIHFRIAEETRPNLYKMTLPGRGFIQGFLAEAVQKKCTHAIIEITSEAAIQYRHLFLSLDALVFTNLAPEHLESHGGIENYFRAKFRIARALLRSSKRPRAIVAPSADPYGLRFLGVPVEERIPFSLEDAEDRTFHDQETSFSFEGTPIAIPHPGAFSILNALAALKAARFLGVPLSTSAVALAKLDRIPGRAERIEAGQDFFAVVDYAHTPDSLRALLEAYPERRKICVFGSTGGGRDTWKRPEMGRVAETYCAEVILTNDDPYDEDPQQIVDAIAAGMTKKPYILLDRRAAIARALALARPGDAVLIAGKGTDPYLMEAHGKKTPWSDAAIVRAELEKLLA